MKKRQAVTPGVVFSAFGCIAFQAQVYSIPAVKLSAALSFPEKRELTFEYS